MKTALILLLSLVSTGPVFAQQQNNRLQPSCGDRRVRFDVRTTKSGTDTNLEPGKSEVYMVEVATPAFPFDRRKITIRIGLDGEWVGAVKGTNTYMPIAVTPGKHHMCAERQSVQASLERAAGFTTFVAEPNKRYYFRARFTEHSGVTLDSISEDEGRLLVSSSGRAIASPTQP
jgi:hypothetical protein